jgi:acetolactate synthase-1/2/3 large subunit
MTVADVVVRELRAAGVRALFGVPGGGSNLDLIDAARRAGMPFVLTATETAAAVAAIAQARVSGAPGACLTTLGPGAASVVNGVACAYLDRAPLIVFTDTAGPAQRDIEHQRLDHAALMRPLVNVSIRLSRERTAELMQEAIAEALGDRPGPVHIDCPAGVATESTVDKPLHLVREIPPPPSGDVAGLDAILDAARRPLVIAGVGAAAPESAAAVRAFCDAARVPALVTYMAKGVVPDRHPWFGGVFTNGAIERALIDECDLILGVGLDPVELLPRPWTFEQPVVYAGPWDVADRHIPYAARSIGTVPACLTDITAKLHATSWDRDAIAAIWDEARHAIAAAGRPATSGALTAQDVVSIAAATFALDATVTVDAGAHMFAATTLWPVEAPNRLLISNGLSTMGFALPAAIGAALADRERRVVALTGDGGLLMCAGDLLTLARERLPVVVIVFADASLSLIAIKQSARGLTPAGVDLGDVDWPSVARGLGVTPFRASTHNELTDAMASAAACDGPALIEARVDPSSHAATLQCIRGAT